MSDSIWADVKSRITLIEVAQRLGFKLRKGLQSSPFRDDKKESFSVFRGKDGHLVFKDHADDACKGGLWQFVQLARPGWSKKEIARWLFDASGVDPTPTEFSKSRSAEKRRKARDQAFMEARIDLHKVADIPRPEPWTEKVAARWKDGSGWLEKNAQRIAEGRGWDESVVLELSGMDLISGPQLPWARESSKGAKAGIAFKVECPRGVSGRAGSLELFPVGYHQRFVTFHSGVRSKSWCFVPYVPDNEKITYPTGFQQFLMAHNRSIPPLPFVLGSLDSPRLVVILEGQWDAITFFHACGWLSDSFCAPVAVFGLRGVNGIEAFLSFYADWLRRIKPQVWLLGDNDRAGRQWAERQDAEKIREKPSFIHRLSALGCERVVYRVIDKKYGKDFNDFYKSASPSSDFMQRWIKSLRIEL